MNSIRPIPLIFFFDSTLRAILINPPWLFWTSLRIKSRRSLLDVNIKHRSIDIRCWNWIIRRVRVTTDSSRHCFDVLRPTFFLLLWSPSALLDDDTVNQNESATPSRCEKNTTSQLWTSSPCHRFRYIYIYFRMRLRGSSSSLHVFNQRIFFDHSIEVISMNKASYCCCLWLIRGNKRRLSSRPTALHSRWTRSERTWDDRVSRSILGAMLVKFSRRTTRYLKRAMTG